MKYTFLAALFLTVVFIGCKKDEKCDEPANTAALTPFASLVAETNFNGDTINVKDLGAFSLDANSDFAFVGEVYPIDLKVFGRVFDCGPSDSLNIRFHQNTDSNGRFAVGSFTHVLNLPNFWTRNTWIKTAIYYNHKTSEVRVYRNKVIAGVQQNVRLAAGNRANLIIGGSNWSNNFPNSYEPNSVMKTKNLRFYKGTITEAQMGALLDAQ